jgi:hypothetical protein
MMMVEKEEHEEGRIRSSGEQEKAGGSAGADEQSG